MIRRLARCAAALAPLTLAPSPAVAQKPAPVPWATGERLEYEVKYGPISAGSARMEVVGLDTVRDRLTWHLHFNVSGGIPWIYRLNDSYDSWMDVETLNSLRFVQRLSEGNRDRLRIYDIFAERGVFIENGKQEKPTVPAPLDDASFLFFVRTIPLKAESTYKFNRYFDPNSNPVTIIVLRRETVEVPAGRFDAVVVQPIIKTSGLFSQGGQAEIWLSDDNRRILLQMKTRTPIGSLNLYLRTIKGAQAPSLVPPGHP
ncbi:MAG: DUF3108 domain-containing protein [Gemmatimonadales bacterium]